MNPFKIKFTVGLLAIVCGFPVSAQSPQAPVAPSQTRQINRPPPDISHIPHVDYVAVRLKGADSNRPRLLPQPLRDKIISTSNTRLTFNHTGGGEVHIFDLPHAVLEAEAEEVAARIRRLPEVEWVDYPRGAIYGFAVPSDPLYSTSQWNLQSGAGGANLPPAWALSTGNPTLVVAVIDSGIIKSHPEFTGRLLAGYDFITNATRANDGGGRDAFSDDPGDWVTQAEVNGGGAFTNCMARNSSWHGTGTAGVIGANANNAIGVAGVDWNVKILPIRVLGKCVNGSVADVTDIADAISWAAGFPVPGVPANTNPSKVINLSFGFAGVCPVSFQSAINDARKRGAVVIAAVGNTEGGSALQNAPANCNGVIRVAATARQGGLAPYSNRGEAASISAPGGDFTSDPLDAIQSPSDGGTTTPLNNGSILSYAGTSSAAPHVAGVASLMLALRRNMNADLIQHTLVNTTRAFPTGTTFDCDTTTCGTGILDAGNAAKIAKSRHRGGLFHTAAIRADGAVVAWGFNGSGQLGGGEAFGVLRSSSGAPITVLPNAADLAAGYYHNAAAMADGTVWTWGFNGQRQLGDGTTTDRATPVQVTGLTNVIAVAAGDRHTLALRGDGTVWAWGYNFFGQLGVGPFDFTDRATPVQVAGLTNVLAIAGGGKRSMALRNDGTVWAWGDVSNVSADGNSASVSSVPVQVAGLIDIVAIAAGGESTTGVNEDVSMALGFDGKVYTWGYNSFGQLGIGNTSTRFLPQLVTALARPAVQITTGGNHTSALLDDGAMWIWGFNGDGELGDGTTTFRTLPVLVTGLSKTVDIAAGPHHTLAFAGDTSLRAWGSNLGGQLGEGTQTDRLTPVQVHGQGNTGFYYAGFTSSASADLAVSMTDSPDPLTLGGNLTYNILLLNGGSSAATNVRAVFALPAQATFVSATTGCTFANASVSCNLGTLAGGSSTTVQVTVLPNAAGTFNASVSVNSALFDANSANDVAAVNTTVTAPVVAANDGDVPTLPEWGAILMGGILLMNMAWMQRRKYRG